MDNNIENFIFKEQNKYFEKSTFYLFLLNGNDLKVNSSYSFYNIFQTKSI